MLSGARQCGKTTTSKSITNENFIYRTLDEITLLKSAQNDPQGFVKLDKGTMIIDEIQRVPELITAIKKAVDENTRYGQYLITGSVNLQTLPTAKESLAGRVKKVRLRTFSYGEILGNEPRFIDRINRCEFINNNGYDKRKMLDIMFKGGYPEAILINNEQERKLWYQDYFNTIIEYDLKDIANIRRHDNLQKLVSVIASYSSKFIDKSKITSAMGIGTNTLDSYLGVLENTFLVDKLSPYLKTDYERVNKQSKYFLTDTGLMSAVLDWNIEDTYFDTDKSGKIFETYVYHQLAEQVELTNGEYSLFHYRDREKREIDFIIESNDTIYGIEVKAGSSVSKESFKHINWFKKNLAKNKKFIGIVLYTGEFSLPFGENLWAVPMNNLWE